MVLSLRSADSRVLLSVTILAVACAPRGIPVTVTRPIRVGSDRATITKDDQAAIQTLNADRQAVLPTAHSPASRSADEIVSSLRVASAVVAPCKSAATQPAYANLSGTVTFTQVGTMLILVADLTGLQPGTSHALEIHEANDLSAPDLCSSGNLWTGDAEHNQPTLGALGNIDADAAGKGYFERTLAGASVGAENSVVGRSIVVREKPFNPDLSASENPAIAGGLIERREQ